ncbi:hypothetical protein Tco_0361877, partial [Tanacetum coccineum]
VKAHMVFYRDDDVSWSDFGYNRLWQPLWPIEIKELNIIDALDRPISTRIQLHEQALFCYYDAFLTSVEPKNYKEALTQACWIEAMQEELHEFEHLEVWELVPPLDKAFVISFVRPPKCGIYLGHGSRGYHVIIRDSRITSHNKT